MTTGITHGHIHTYREQSIVTSIEAGHDHPIDPEEKRTGLGGIDPHSHFLPKK